MSRRNPTDIGKRAEDHALAYLRRHGLELVARNWRWRGGEIDLILREEATLVFAEVRYRASDRFGGAALSVDRRKQRRLLQGASLFLAYHDNECPVRFDVLALTPEKTGFKVEWIKDAFRTDP